MDMEVEESHPSDLKEALSVTPFDHLIPKQDIAPLIASASIDTISKNTDSVSVGDSEEISNALKMRDMINSEPERFKSALNFLVKDFEDFEDNELDDLVFKKPIMSNSSKVTNTVNTLPPFERRLYDSIDSIPHDAIRELKVDLDASEFEESRLSVRKNYDLDDKDALNTHNKTYEKKFKKEYRKMKDTSSLNIALDRKRRPLEEDHESTEMEAKRRHAVAPAKTNDERAKQAYDNLPSLINNIKARRDESSDESRQHYEKEITRVTSLSSMISLYDHFVIIINSPYFQELDIGCLFDVKKLCVDTLGTFNIESVEFNASVTGMESNLATIYQPKIDECLIHIFAARIILLIVNSTRSEKQLHSSEHLNGTVDFLYSLVEQVITDIAKKSSDESTELLPIKTSFSNLVTEVVSLFNQLNSYIEKHELEEHIITKLEYMSISVIFSEINSKVKSSYISLSTFENLRIAACETILVIFKTKSEQRKFILNELYSNLNRLPLQRNIARQYRLSRGGNIQSFTMLLIRLIHSYDINKYVSIASNTVHAAITNKNDQLSFENNKKMLIDSSVSLFQESISASEEIAKFLVSKLQQSPENQYKQSLELILEDILTVMNCPEWPGAEIIANAIMRELISAIREDGSSAQFETYAIELIGMIGVKYLELIKSSENSHSLTSSSTVDDIVLFQRWFSDTLQYLQAEKLKSELFVSSFRYLLLKYTSYVGPICLAHHGNQSADQLAALNSDPDEDANSMCAEELEKVFISLAYAIADDSISMNHVLNTELDSSSINSYTYIISNDTLQNLYESFLRTIRWGLESNKTKTKTRAIKALSSLLDRDASLLQSGEIQGAISNKLQDPSPLVRDAVIDLINKYVNSRSEVIEQFHIPVCEHLNDHSIQVRKRVIKIAKEMYLHAEKRSVRSQIATKMLRRIEDEDDVIQDTAKAYLLDLWFLSLESETKNSDETTITSLCLRRIEVMMDTISSGSKNYTLFEEFITTVALSNANNEVRNAMVICIDKAIDFIIDCSDTKLHSQVEKAVRLLALFIQCDGTLLDQNHLTALQPLIIDSDHSSKTISFYVLQIFKNVLPFMKSLRPEFVDSTQSHLLKQLTKYSAKELHEAMPCVWRLCKINKVTIKLANAAISCMKMIRPYIDKSKKQEEKLPDPKLHKLLHLVGCFGSYCNFERHRDLFLKSSIGLKQKETVISIIMKFLLFFCGQNYDVSTRNVAITNTILVCGSHPKLFLSDPILKIFDRELGGQEIIIKYSIISGLFEFIQKEDKEARRKTAESSISSDISKLDLATFHGSSASFINDGICAGIVQRYISVALDLCVFDSGDFSLLPIQFLQMVIQFGFANPKICMPTILALQSSPNPQIRLISNELHQAVFEKHESLIDSCYVEGLKIATSYRKRLSDDFLQERFFMNRLYSIVKENQSSRKRFVNSVKTLLNVDCQVKSLDELEAQRDQVIFICNNVSSLSFCSIEEILLLLCHLNKIVMSQGIDLADSLKGELPETDLNEKYAKGVICQSFIVLLSLYIHLKSSYSISHSLIESFSPKRTDADLRQPPKIVQLNPFVLDRLVEVDCRNSEVVESIFGKFLEQIHYYSQ